VICDVCRITHHNDEAYVGALAVVIAIRSILTGDWSHNRSFLAAVADSIPDSAVRDRVEEFLPLKVPPSEIASRFGASGWVVDTVRVAKQPLTKVIAQAIDVGGDTDTIASITGQVAGTAAGAAPEFRGHFSRVIESDEVSRIAEHFANFVCERRL